MKCNYLLVCEQAAVTQDNKMVIHGVFHNLNGPAVPLYHHQMFIVFELTDYAEDEDRSVVLAIVDETSGERTVVTEQVVESNGKERFTGMVQMVATIFKNFGNHRVELSVGGKVIASTVVSAIRSV